MFTQLVRHENYELQIGGTWQFRDGFCVSQRDSTQCDAPLCACAQKWCRSRQVQWF